MIKFGTIGTSKICEEFIANVKKSEGAKIVACYSRDVNRAKEFIEKNSLKARAFDNFNDMLLEIDAIYIASPNGFHFEQVLYFISQQKHVLVEKPLTLDFNEALQLYEASRKNKVILMEAFKLIHLPQFSFLDDFTKKYLPYAASFSLNTFSSRMKDVKKGIYKSVFDEKTGKGSTYDMLVYPVELSIALFGAIKKVKSFSHILPNGVSISDAVIMHHENGIITNIMCSKSGFGKIDSEILSEEGTLTFSNMLKIENINLYDSAEDKNYLLFERNVEEIMSYELQVFLKMIIEDDLSLCDYLLKISCETVRVLNEVEKQNK